MNYKAILCAALVGASCVGSVTLQPAYANENIAPAIDETVENKPFFRTSIEGKSEGIEAEYYKWDFECVLCAYENGRIHIDVQCLKSSSINCNKIGSIVFDDNVIAGIGEKGASGTSGFNNHENPNSRYTLSYPNGLVGYTAVYSDNDSLGKVVGQTLMSFDFYVKSTYMDAPVTILLFGKEIKIPFEEVNCIKGDVNGDKKIDASDVSILQKWLLTESANLPQWNAADMNNDKNIDARDLSLIKQELLKSTSYQYSLMYAASNTSPSFLLSGNAYFYFLAKTEQQMYFESSHSGYKGFLSDDADCEMAKAIYTKLSEKSSGGTLTFLSEKDYEELENLFHSLDESCAKNSIS